jgi:hypothetical protein
LKEDGEVMVLVWYLYDGCSRDGKSAERASSSHCTLSDEVTEIVASLPRCLVGRFHPWTSAPRHRGTPRKRPMLSPRSWVLLLSLHLCTRMCSHTISPAAHRTETPPRMGRRLTDVPRSNLWLCSSAVSVTRIPWHTSSSTMEVPSLVRSRCLVRSADHVPGYR